jgi:TatD DNase family protein
MNLPVQGDYIDIHIHDGKPGTDIFIVENIMAHENKLPGNIPRSAFSIGIHPWFLNEDNSEQLLNTVKETAKSPYLIAIGEAGFDKLRGPSIELQFRTFEEQIAISEEIGKPLFIHCVRAWDELHSAHKNNHPKVPWMVHGFRGKKELAAQLIAKGMYLSFWYDHVIRPGSTDLLRSLPRDRIFLETDGADVDIREIYKKVAGDLNVSVEELKNIIYTNFQRFFLKK